MAQTTHIHKGIELLCVGFGCACAAMLRFGAQHLLDSLTYDDIAIMAVNIVGCGILGLLTSIVKQKHTQPYIHKMLTTGFCGGLTTFSSFAGDTFHMLQTQPWLALLFIVCNMVGGLLAFYFGSLVPMQATRTLE